MRRFAGRTKVLFLLLVLVPAAQAGAQDDIHWKDRWIQNSGHYLKYHPDQRHRREGLQAYEDGDHAQAYAHFLEAARYADKPSQAAIAAMLWDGVGVDADRAAAYAWMDIAAERGYEAFLVQRERYWSQLDEGLRQRALKVGEELHAEYGDSVAKRRLGRLLKRATRWAYNSVTHAAYASWGFYEAKHWTPHSYWKSQDRIWRSPPETGTVTVGPLQIAEEPADDPAVESVQPDRD